MHGNERHSRRGFTLVELLVTVTVIGIIVAMAMGALMSAQEAAREQRTRAVISKLHTQLMSRWESYQTRRLPMAIPAGTTNDRAWHRLHAVRELMRLEMPDRWNDIYDPSNGPDFNVNPRTLGELPALSEAYLRFYRSLSPPPTHEYESAECLYLIVTMGHDDQLGTSAVRPSDVGDVDQDGAKEFLDGWGNPIRFLRWAPGFLPQRTDATGNAIYAGHGANVYPPGLNLPPGTDVKAINAFTDLQSGDRDGDHDPFDPLQVDKVPAMVLPFPLSNSDRQAIANDEWRGFRLMPLIYSAGPDGRADIRADYDFDGDKVGDLNYSAALPLPNDPYIKSPPIDSPPFSMLGTPADLDDDKEFDHVDNITNHALEVR